MNELFLKAVNMSISAGYLVLAVLILRLLFKKAPKWINILLWGMVGIRLVFPFSFESAMSLIPSAETISPDMTVNTGFETINSTVNPVIEEQFAPAPEYSADPLQIWMDILPVIWITGIILMLIYALLSYISLKRRVSTSIPLKENIYQSEHIASPFVLGFIHPKIYIPFNVEEKSLPHILAHEKAHIKRKDHWIKPIAFVILAVYWFNPLMWVAYILLSRDIELACDEKVIRELGHDEKADYSEALLNCSVKRRNIALCPLAFGEVGVKERVKSILNYKKPAFWIIITALVVSAVAGICFLTNPAEKGYDFSNNPIKEVIVSGEEKALLDTESISGLQAELQDLKVKKNRNAVPVTNAELKFDVILTDDTKILIYGLNNGYVYLEVSGEIYETKDRDFISYLKGLSEQKLSVISPDTKQHLTLEDVEKLSHKGNELTWADFDNFYYSETGSGLYIRVYEIDDMFSLSIGGTHYDENPMYFYLSANDGTNTEIDIRKSSVSEYIDAHKDNEILHGHIENAIHSAIMNYYEPEKPDGLINIESHIVYSSEDKLSAEENSSVKETKVYVLVLYESFNPQNMQSVRREFSPAEIVFSRNSSEEYHFEKYTEYKDSDKIKTDFPQSIREEISKNLKSKEKELSEKNKKKMEQSLSSDASDKNPDEFPNQHIDIKLHIAKEFDMLSSSPDDYTEKYPEKISALVSFDYDTLEYCFSEFRKRNCNNARGDIMRHVCEIIIHNHNEDFSMADGNFRNSQEWFDKFEEHSYEIKKNASSMSEFKKNHPICYMITNPAHDLPVPEVFETAVEVVYTGEELPVRDHCYD